MLSVRFPNAKCLDYLDFAEFKRRTLDAVNQKGSSSGEKPKVPVQKNEPIFKKLTDEIKGLQAGQSVYEQYIKAATSCYQRVILDLGNEVISKLIEQDHRMKSLEDEVLKLYIRSSLGIKNNLELSNIVGIIDCDYYNNKDTMGNIGISIRNKSNEIVTIEKNTRIVQGIFIKYLVSDNCNTFNIRIGGFGSTNG
jgi:dUTPase